MEHRNNNLWEQQQKNFGQLIQVFVVSEKIEKRKRKKKKEKGKSNNLECPIMHRNPNLWHSDTNSVERGGTRRMFAVRVEGQKKQL